MNETEPEPHAARRIFLRWEKLRLPFNLVLVLTVLIMLRGVRDKTPTELARFLIPRAVVANIAFTAAPGIEALAGRFGVRAYPFVT